MKRAILMRHAKSDWNAGSGGDHARPLNPRGRRAAAELGAWLRRNDLIPDQVLCSDAMRTRETLQRLDLPEGIATTLRPDLYLARQEAILAALQGAAGDCVLMLGHSPGIGWSAGGLVKEVPDHPQFVRYPTGATLVAGFDIATWSEADWGKAKALHFVVPRELEA
jgi:phosphohistidine phosphatase